MVTFFQVSSLLLTIEEVELLLMVYKGRMLLDLGYWNQVLLLILILTNPPWYSLDIASNTLSTDSCFRRVTVQPPNPPPVILLPYTPSTWILELWQQLSFSNVSITFKAASTKTSSSAQETSKSSLELNVLRIVFSETLLPVSCVSYLRDLWLSTINLPIST